MSVGVVDEAVYGVKPDDTPDPVAFFYRRQYSSVSTSFSRTYTFTGYSGTQVLQLAQRRRRPMGLADFKADRPARDRVRKEFPDAIFWVADLVTDATGTATVKVSYPDSLTTWRVTARAVTEDTRLGAAVARTTTTKDVIVRVATPRFLTEGDTVRGAAGHPQLPAGVAQPFSIGLTASGVTATAATSPGAIQAGHPVEGRAPQFVELQGVRGRARRPSLATRPPGRDGDAAQMTLPVLPYGLVREVGASGTLDGDLGADRAPRDPRAVEPGGPHHRRLARALAGRLDAQRARLPHRLSRTAAPSRRCRASCRTCS